MENLHLKAKTVVKFDDVEHVCKNLGEMFDALHIPNEEAYHNTRVAIVQRLIVFGELDMSRFYPGHTVIVTNDFFEEE